MSYIIEQLNNSLFQYNNPYNQQKYIQNTELDQQSISLQKVRQNLIKSLGVLNNSLIQSCIVGSQIIVKVLVTHLFRNISMIFKMVLNMKTQQLKISFQIMDNHNKFIILNGKQRRILFCKILASRYYISSFQEFTMVIKIQTGEILFYTPIYYFNKTSIHNIIKLPILIFKQFVTNLKILTPSINFVKEICNQSSKEFYSEYKRRGQNDKLSKIYQKTYFANIYVNLTLDSTNQQSSILQKQKKEMGSLEELRNYYIQEKEKNGLELFVMDLGRDKDLANYIKKYQINYNQRQTIAEITALPPITKAKIPQNNYILNFIKLNKNIEDLCLRKLNYGGFTDIFLTQVQYWYVGSYSATTNLISNIPPLKKLIIVKREKEPISDGQRNRIAHQKFILTKIKHGVSLFLPKYYINSDRDEDNQILSDFINSPTLGDYFYRNKQTMSYQTKIYFGYMIAQGLRYLQQYNIVHLDLKPPNIMLSKNMMIKLIDFGESYHPDINSQNFKPGMSIPYSAPQNYTNTHYTYKNDVFSLGIILYELIFSKFPFFINDRDKRQEIYKSGLISDYWFCLPEQNMNFGESQVFPLLQLLIGKCISQQPRERPQLQWIVYILRTCLDYLQSTTFS